MAQVKNVNCNLILIKLHVKKIFQLPSPPEAVQLLSNCRLEALVKLWNGQTEELQK